MFRKLFPLLFTLTLLLSACDISGSGTLPTPYPESYLPTVIALTAAASRPDQAGPSAGSPFPALDPTPTPTPLPPTETPVPSATPSPTPSLSSAPPDGVIRLAAPGPMSKVVSPLRVIAYVVPGANDRYQVELLGEDGRLLARKVEVHPAPAYSPWVYVALDIPFEIRAAAELARLQISTADEFGLPKAVMSVHVLLQSGGRDVINPSGGTGERAWLSSPLAGSQVTGGEVVVSGKFRPFNEESFILELLDREGRVLGTRLLELGIASAPDGYIPFSTTVPYSVGASTPAKLVLRQSDPRINGLMYLYSLELILHP